MIFVVRVVYAERILFRRDVVAQRKVELVYAVHTARNRRDGVVRLAVRLRKNERVLVRVTSPRFQYMVGRVNQALRVFMAQTQNRYRPVQYARFHIFKAVQRAVLLHVRARHRKRIVAALVVVVCQNGTANDGQIGIRAEEIVRKLLHKIKQLVERALVNLHRHMLAAEHNAVLIVVHIRRILQKPIRMVHRDRDCAVVLSCRVVHAARITDILLAQHTGRITGSLHFLCRSNGLRIFFRL